MPVVDRELFFDICSRVPVFKDISREDLWNVANKMNYVFKFPAGEIIIKQGATDQAMFVVLSGTCNVVHSDCPDRAIVQINQGEIFGEMSLLSGQPRSATVKAGDVVTVLKIDKDLLTLLPPLVREKFKDRLIEVLLGRINKVTRLVAHLAAGGTLPEA